MLEQSLEEALALVLSSNTFPGYAAAIVTPVSIKTFAGGRHTYESSSPLVTDTTLYDIASITKIIGPMTLAMKMIDDGKIFLDDPIGKYIPEFVTDDIKAQATIRHLLTYTLEYDLPFGAKSLMKELSPEELDLRMITVPLKALPGTSYLYSNITAFILAQVIERATQENFYTLVTRKIFTPLSMMTATFTPDKNLWPQIPPTEITAERGIIQGFVHDESTDYLQSKNISSGAAGLFASVTDVAHFLQMVISDSGPFGEFFSTDMRLKWTKNQFPDLLPTLTPLGFGDTNNEMLVERPGRFVVKGGFTGCFMIGDTKNNIGIVVLSNLTYPTRPKERRGFTKLKEDIVSMMVRYTK